MEKPNFKNRLLKAIYCDGEPDRVPLVEAGIDSSIKERFLGHEIRSLKDEIEFWSTAGYDFIPLEAGLRTIIDAAIHHESTGRFSDTEQDSRNVIAAKNYAVEKLQSYALTSRKDDGGLRTWAPEGKSFITDMNDLESFPWPDPEDLDYNNFRTIQGLLPEGMGVITFAGAIFSSLMLMMGTEECLIGMAKSSELFEALLKRVAEFQIKVIEILMGFESVGAIWINDDMGFRSRTLVNPNLYRKYTFPYYREIKQIVQEKGIPLLLHSDGNITSILQDLVDIGFNAIHPIEPEAMNIIQAREIVGDKVCLIGNLSLTYPLGIGTPKEVSHETNNLIRKMAPGGGYCLSSGNSIPDYVPYENWLAMRDAALQVGVYPING